jgi:hypothetical protein
VRYITLLRDPLKILLSRFMRNKRKSQPDAQITPEEVTAVLRRRRNPLLRFLRHSHGFDLKRINEPVTEEDLERGKETLAKRLDTFGLTERFDESMMLFARELKWENVPEYAVKNTSNNRPEVIPQSVLALGRERNALDYAFYEFAENLFDDRLKATKLAG